MISGAACKQDKASVLQEKVIILQACLLALLAPPLLLVDAVMIRKNVIIQTNRSYSKLTFFSYLYNGNAP